MPSLSLSDPRFSKPTQPPLSVKVDAPIQARDGNGSVPIKDRSREPDYRGQLSVAAWVMKDKNGKEFLSVNISNHVNLFLNERKLEAERK